MFVAANKTKSNIEFKTLWITNNIEHTPTGKLKGMERTDFAEVLRKYLHRMTELLCLNQQRLSLFLEKEI